ncbi:MAG: hypothetical protein RR342_01295 [Bacilli bacterium]
MLTTDLDFRVKKSGKVIQIGISVKELGPFIVIIDKEPEAFFNFVLGIEHKEDVKYDKWVLVTARAVNMNKEFDLKFPFSEIAFRADDIMCCQNLGDLEYTENK